MNHGHSFNYLTENNRQNDSQKNYEVVQLKHIGTKWTSLLNQLYFYMDIKQQIGGFFLPTTPMT